MPNSVAKKFGLFTSLTMLIGSVVGIGVFFKSHGILRSNDWNGTGTLVAWIIGGLISLAAAISFSEISSMKTKNVHGLPGWSEKVGGKAYGFFTRFNYSFFYFGIMNVVLAYFGSEMVFSVVGMFTNQSVGDFPVYAHIILGLTLSAFMFAMNYFSTRASGIFQNITTVLKWVPLLIVAFAGLILLNTNTHPKTEGAAHFGQNAFHNGTSFQFTKMLSALPAILFAFDAFLNVGSLRSKMKNPSKLPFVVFMGMLSVLILYILIALAAILHGSGLVSGAPMGASPADGYGIFDQIFNKETAQAMGKFTIIMIAISTFGVMNGMSAASVSLIEQSIETNTIFGMKFFRRKVGDLWTLFIYEAFTMLFWTFVVGLPAAIMNSDVIIDGASNMPTLFFFAVYGTTILLYIIKRGKMETKKMNKFIFYTFAIFAVLGITIGVGYQLFYGFFIEAIMHQDLQTHWGLYAANSYDGKFTTFNAMPFYLSMLVIFFAAPIISLTLSKTIEKRTPIIDTQIIEQTL